MNKLFVDTSGWMAAADGSEFSHKKMCIVRDDWLEKGGLLITTDYVIDETLTLIRFRMGLKASELWLQQTEESSRIRIEWINELRFEKTKHLFLKLKDKKISFTDCTSFVVMHEMKLRKALTLDKHFKQNGFEVLP
ncbi:MAG: type II toxin-antitoxin system VapC family toxin [Gammaproteobacteria bacterium]|nr:type II toxin-antitoxin system VapC family toxin [Gammaproteobacteria bacterium]